MERNKILKFHHASTWFLHTNVYLLRGRGGVTKNQLYSPNHCTQKKQYLLKRANMTHHDFHTTPIHIFCIFVVTKNPQRNLNHCKQQKIKSWKSNMIQHVQNPKTTLRMDGYQRKLVGYQRETPHSTLSRLTNSKRSVSLRASLFEIRLLSSFITSQRTMIDLRLRW